MINAQREVKSYKPLQLGVGLPIFDPVSDIHKKIQDLWEINHDDTLETDQTLTTFNKQILAKERRLLTTFSGFPTIVQIDAKGMPVFQWIENPDNDLNDRPLRFVSLGKEKILYTKPEVAHRLCEQKTRQTFKNTYEMDLVFAHFKEFLSAGVPRDSYLYSCQTHAAWMSYIMLHFFKLQCEECFVESEDQERLTPSLHLFPAYIPYGWYFHAAVQVACQNGSNTETYILDPTLDKPVLRSRWIAGLQDPTGMRKINYECRTKWQERDILHRISYAREVLISLCNRYS